MYTLGSLILMAILLGAVMPVFNTLTHTLKLDKIIKSSERMSELMDNYLSKERMLLDSQRHGVVLWLLTSLSCAACLLLLPAISRQAQHLLELGLHGGELPFHRAGRLHAERQFFRFAMLGEGTGGEADRGTGQASEPSANGAMGGRR